jgi:hypothetical protein
MYNRDEAFAGERLFYGSPYVVFPPYFLHIFPITKEVA